MPKSKSKALARKSEVVRLHKEGLKLDEIAERVGYANRGTVYNVLTAAYLERTDDDVEEIRARDLVKLDQTEVVLWDIALNSKSDAAKVSAVAQLVNVSKQRARLLGMHEKKSKYGGGSPVIFDVAVRQLRKPYTCRLNNEHECGFEPELHGSGCSQPLAGEVLDAKFSEMGRAVDADPDAPTPTSDLDLGPEGESAFLV